MYFHAHNLYAKTKSYNRIAILLLLCRNPLIFMRFLIIVLLLFPASAFCQLRQKAMIDSITAAGHNIGKIGKHINNTPGSKIESISSIDSEQYVTITIKVKLDNTTQLAHIPHSSALHFLPTTLSDIFTPSLAAVPTLVLYNRDSIPQLPPAALALFSTPIHPSPLSASTTSFKLPDVAIDIEPVKPLSIYPLSIKLPKQQRLASYTPPPIELAPEPETLPIAEVQLFPISLTTFQKQLAVVMPDIGIKDIPLQEMHLSEDGYLLLEKMEGFSPELYTLKDGGFTIGFGFFIPYNEAAKWRKGISIEEARKQMRKKMPTYEDQVKQFINVPLTQEEFDALTMLAYNLGGFSKATSIVNDVNNKVDVEKLHKSWMRFVHSKAPGVTAGLMARRTDEMAVRREANYQPERKLLIYKNRK